MQAFVNGISGHAARQSLRRRMANIVRETGFCGSPIASVRADRHGRRERSLWCYASFNVGKPVNEYIYKATPLNSCFRESSAYFKRCIGCFSQRRLRTTKKGVLFAVYNQVSLYQNLNSYFARFWPHLFGIEAAFCCHTAQIGIRLRPNQYASKTLFAPHSALMPLSSGLN